MPGGRTILLLLLWALPCAAGDDRGWLVDVTDAWGLDFVHATGATGRLEMPEIMGGGVAVFDADGDGRLDLYFVHAGRNRLYRRSPAGRYEDATAASGLGDEGTGMGVAAGDIDNDGDVDLYVTNHGPDRLFRNRGDGTFEETGARAGAAVPGWSTSATFLDYDRDGLLDLFVTRYVRYVPDKRCRDVAGRPDYCSPALFAPEPDVLLHNLGEGRFAAASDAAGIRRAFGAGLGVVATDFDGDGRTDLYVANDGDANQLWTNRGDGTFRDDSLLAGVAYNLDGEAEAGMGVVAADLDGDADLDLFLTHLSDETHTFYRNLGAGRGFEDATGAAGLAAGSLDATGFGVAAIDLECDGDADLVVVNGRVSGGPRAAGDASPWTRFAEPNQLWINAGGGRFSSEDVAPEFTGPREISRALAVGDLDGDGDLDLVVVNTEGRARLFRNDAPRRGRFWLVRAVDPRLRRDALGARIEASAGGRRVVGVVGGGSSYLASSDPRVHLGLGAVDSVERLEVLWPDGLRERFPVPALDREIRLERGAGGVKP